MYVRHPFPPAQRKYSYRRHAAYVRRFLAGQGVDEFRHVRERHLQLRDIVSWLRDQEMRVVRMTDYYDQEIPLEVGCHSSNSAFTAMAEKLPFESQCHVIDMIVRPYWLSLFAEKAGA